jgi:hypothetical protein
MNILIIFDTTAFEAQAQDFFKILFSNIPVYNHLLFLRCLITDLILMSMSLQDIICRLRHLRTNQEMNREIGNCRKDANSLSRFDLDHFRPPGSLPFPSYKMFTQLIQNVYTVKFLLQILAVALVLPVVLAKKGRVFRANL